MPRDSNGNYSLPNGTIVADGDTILPAQHNPAMQDLGQSIGNSLSRDGLGGMRADLKMGGFKAVNMADGAAATDAATVGQLAAYSVPIGGVLDYAGATPPPSYLLCYGQAVSRTTYAALFAAIGTAYGAGDGSTTFNVPDARGRTGVGKDDMGGTSANRLSDYMGTTLGAGFGAQNHVLTTAQLAAHSHGVTDPGHAHNYSTVSPSGGIGSGAAFGQSTAATDPAATGITIASTGSDAAHPNVQPSLVFNKIVRAL